MTKSLPTVASNPDYSKALAKLAELQQEETALERERSEISATLSRQQDGVTVGSFTGGAQRAAALTLKAAALLDNDPVELPATSSAQLRERLGTIAERLAVVREAIRLQSLRVRRAQEDASRTILTEVRPQYDELVKALVLANIAAARANEAARQFVAELEAGGLVGITAQLTPLWLGTLGSVADEHSTIRFHLREVAAAGYKIPPLPEIEVAVRAERVQADRIRSLDAARRAREAAAEATVARPTVMDADWRPAA